MRTIKRYIDDNRKKRAFFLLLMILISCAAAPTAMAVGEKANSKVLEAKKGVVRVFTAEQLTNPHYFSTGSGFAIGRAGEETDVFATNRHVVFDEKTGKISKNVYILLNDNAVKRVYGNGGFYDDELGLRFDIVIDESEMIRCEVLYPSDNDPEFPDFAILRAERTVPGRQALPLMQADETPDSATVWAIGYPGSADMNYNLDPENAEMKYEADVEGAQLFSGTISTRGRNLRFDGTYALTHNAQIDHGNSGGPLVNEQGAVIGINTYGFQSSDTSYVGYNQSVYIDYVMNKLDELGLSYATYKEKNDTALYICVATAVVVFVGVLLYAGIKRKKKDGGISGTKEPKPVGERKEYRLQGVSGCFAGRRFPINGEIRLGRGKDGNDLIFPDNTPISRYHCRIMLDRGDLYLEDLDSRNGTWLNENKLMPRQRVSLHVGDCFYLATDKESFRIDSKRKEA